MLLAATVSAVAGPYDPPVGYYSTATGTGATLKSQLHDIIDNHTVFSYGSARSILQITDQDPDDADRMLLVYNRVSLDVSAINPGGSIPGWDSGSSWNREHTWPRSLGVGSSGPDNSDLHQLRPSNPGVNTSRGNLDFGGEFGAQSFGAVNDGGAFWYPGDTDAGMIARQQFYMAVRYDGSDSNTSDLELASGNPLIGLGNLDRLVEWHFAAPPDDFELRRNDLIHDNYQGNRIPFVDHPEWVWSVFVDQNNDTQLTLAGGSTDASGGSALSVDLGRVYVGGSAPSDQVIAIDKSGQDGTYFEVSATGEATSSLSGGLNAFALGGPGSQALTVGLDTTTASSGLKTGSVAIDNLDVTNGLGAGFGAGDADDVISLSFAVLDQPVASLSDTAQLGSTTIDLGVFTLGQTAPAIPFEIVNYTGDGAPGFASDLDLDAVQGTGDTAALTTDLAPFTGLAQGGSAAFLASLDTSAAGDFSADYLLTLSGEDLPGEQQQQIMITLTGQVAGGSLPGDANSDGTVDLLDLDVLGTNFVQTPASFEEGDFNGDNVVDLLDLDILGANFGQSSTAAAVPEPAALVLLLCGLVCPLRRKT